MAALTENQIKIINEVFKQLNTIQGNKSKYLEILKESKNFGSVSKGTYKLTTQESRIMFIKWKLEDYLKNHPNFRDQVFKKIATKDKTTVNSISKTFNSVLTHSKFKEKKVIPPLNEKIKKIQEKIKLRELKISQEKAKISKVISEKYLKEYEKYKNQTTNTQKRKNIMKIRENLERNTKKLYDMFSKKSNKRKRTPEEILEEEEMIQKTVDAMLQKGIFQDNLYIQYDYDFYEKDFPSVKNLISQLSQEARHNPLFDMTEYMNDFSFEMEWFDDKKNREEAREKYNKKNDNFDDTISRTVAGKILKAVFESRQKEYGKIKAIEDLEETILFEPQDIGYDPSEGQSRRRIIYVKGNVKNGELTFDYEYEEEITKGLGIAVSSYPKINVTQLSQTLSKQYNEATKKSVAIKKEMDTIKAYQKDIDKINKEIDSIENISARKQKRENSNKMSK